MRFSGDTYEHARDSDRLTAQYETVWALMTDGEWRSLQEIAEITNYSTASAGARLRDMRKERFGSHRVDRRYEGEGLFRYKLIRSDGLNKGIDCEQALDSCTI